MILPAINATTGRSDDKITRLNEWNNSHSYERAMPANHLIAGRHRSYVMSSYTPAIKR